MSSCLIEKQPRNTSAKQVGQTNPGKHWEIPFRSGSQTIKSKITSLQKEQGQAVKGGCPHEGCQEALIPFNVTVLGTALMFNLFEGLLKLQN